MTKVIRFLAQCIDQNTGDVLEESIMNEEVLQKATILQELGYTHIKQINFLQQMQDFKIKHQIILLDFGQKYSLERLILFKKITFQNSII